MKDDEVRPSAQARRPLSTEIPDAFMTTPYATHHEFVEHAFRMSVANNS